MKIVINRIGFVYRMEKNITIYLGVFVVLVLLNFETLFAIRHHLPGGIDLSISEFFNFIIYCFLASQLLGKW
jgi:hypothetical protein